MPTNCCLHEIIKYLEIIDRLPHRRKQQQPGDLQGNYDLWFDGGAVRFVTGYNEYFFEEGVIITEHIIPDLLINIQFPNGERFYLTNITPIHSKPTPDVFQKDSLFSNRQGDNVPTSTDELIGFPTGSDYEKFSERWVPIKQINQGGMGEIWIAEDKNTGKKVGIKQLRPITRTSSLLQECRALQKLDHPGIVKLFDFHIRKEKSYMVMEYIEGVSLADYLKVHQSLVEPVVIHLAKQLFSAAAYAHANEILHCDLKPGNIMLELGNGSLKAKIIDFGLAVVDQYDDRGERTAYGRQAGTPIYMAPEQYRGDILSGAADIYALGEILLQMLTGEFPFSKNPIMALQEKISSKEGLVINNPQFKVSNGLANLIKACTHPDPSQRPTTANVLSALEGLTTVSYPCVPAPYNLGFKFTNSDFWEIDDTWSKTGLEGEQPAGWFNSVGYVANVDPNFEWLVEKGIIPHLEISTKDQPGTFSSVMQRIPAKYLAGKQIRFSGQLSSEKLSGWAGMWLRADGEGRTLYFDNMHSHPIRSSTNWQLYILEAEIPQEVEWLNYGVLIVGGGKLKAENFKIEVQMKDKSWLNLGLWNDNGYLQFQDEMLT